MIAGIVLIAFPHPSLLLLAFFVGAWLTVSGGFQIVMSFARRRELRHWGLTLAVGVVELLLGIWAMRRPDVTLSLLIDIIGLWAVDHRHAAVRARVRGPALAAQPDPHVLGAGPGEPSRSPSGWTTQPAPRRRGAVDAEYMQLKNTLLASLRP